MLLSGILSISAYDFTQFHIVQNMFLAWESPEGSACELIEPIPRNTFTLRRPHCTKNIPIGEQSFTCPIDAFISDSEALYINNDDRY